MAHKDDVVEEFLFIEGRYWVRLLRVEGKLYADIREWLPGRPGRTEGFTRRGIRVSLPEAERLRDALNDLIEKGRKEAKGDV